MAVNLETLYNLTDDEVKEKVKEGFLILLKNSPSVKDIFFPGATMPYWMSLPVSKDYVDNMASAMVCSAISRSLACGFNATVDQKAADKYWITGLQGMRQKREGQALYDFFFSDHCRNEECKFYEYERSTPKEWATALADEVTTDAFVNNSMLKLFAAHQEDYWAKLNLILYKIDRLDSAQVPRVVKTWMSAHPKESPHMSDWYSFDYIERKHFAADQFLSEAVQAIVIETQTSKEYYPGSGGMNPRPGYHTYEYTSGVAVAQFLNGKPRQLGLVTGASPNNKRREKY